MSERAYLSEISAAVMIGGRSKRFGRDKIVEQIDGVMMVERVLSVLEGIFSEIMLIGHGRPELSRFRVIPDMIPGVGPLGGIYTALVSSPSPHCFVFAADMPRLNEGLIGYMASVKKNADIIVPRWQKGIEPLHAIYSKSLSGRAGKLIHEKLFRIRDLFRDSSVHEVGEDAIRAFGSPSEIFANINSAGDIIDTFKTID